MSKPFDMELFLIGGLKGSKLTRQRHIRQAKIMQQAIQRRWCRDNPWTWQCKHVFWFLNQHLKNHSLATRYYYHLTVLLIWKRQGRAGKPWETGGGIHDLEIGSRRVAAGLKPQNLSLSTSRINFDVQDRGPNQHCS